MKHLLNKWAMNVKANTFAYFWMGRRFALLWFSMGKWSHSAGTWFICNRWYYKGYQWTPIVSVQWRFKAYGQRFWKWTFWLFVIGFLAGLVAFGVCNGGLRWPI